MSDSVTVSRDGAVGIITLNNPQRRNALNTEVVLAVEEAIITLEATRTANGTALAGATPAGTDPAGTTPAEGPVRAILIRGEGPAFCAGADLKGGVYAADFFDGVTRMLTAISRCPIPVIADVQGPAVGAGCQIVLACDLRVFGNDGAVWVPAAEHGFALDTWTHQRLQDLLGGAHARNIMIGGLKVTAEQALAMGFAIEQTDAAGALAFAHRVARQAPISMEHSKRVLNSPDPFGDASLDMLFRKAWASEDAQEARAARAERRAPRFIGK